MSTNPPRVDATVFQTVTDAITEGIVAFEADGTIVFANPAARELLGYTPGELLERSVGELLADDQGSVLVRLQRQVILDERTPVEGTVVDRGGREIPVLLTLYAESSSDRDLYIATFQEDRASDSPSPDRAEYERRLKALNRASRRLMAARTVEEIAQITIDVVETVLRRSLTAVWQATEGDALHAVAASEQATSASGGSTAEPMPPITTATTELTVFEDGEPALVEEYDAVANPAHPEMDLEERFLVPLGSHGLLGVGSTGNERIDTSVQELIEILGKNTRAALDRLEREHVINQHSAAIDAAIDGMAITNDEGVFTYVNDVYARLFGYDGSDALVGTNWQALFAPSEVERYESEVLPTISEHGSWRGEAVGTTTAGAEIPLEISLSLLADGSGICIARDITERKAQERQLEALNDGIRELMTADEREAVSQVSIDAVEDVLGFERACLRLFDPERNRLDYAALTDAAEAVLEQYTVYDFESTLAGRAFREEKTVVDHRSVDAPRERSGVDYSSVHVPIGPHGVLTVLVGSDAELDERSVQLTELLAVNARTAITRADRVQQLKAHDREMRRQRDQLETHTEINELVQEIGRQLLEATTREELEETICSRLVATDLYHSAWIGDVEVSSDRLGTRVGFGISTADLEAIEEMPMGSIAHGTVERMLETGSVEVVRSYQRSGEYSNPDSETTAADVISTAAIPLTYGDHLFGVLVVSGSGESLFGEETVSGFDSLGNVTGFAINAIRNRRLLLSDSVIELEFAVSDPDTFYLALTEAPGCECRFERSVPIEEGKILNYHTVTGTDPEAVLAAAADSDQIEDARVLSDGDESLLLQTRTSNSTAHAALQVGATLRSAVAADGEARLVFEAPGTANVREIVALFDEQFSDLQLVAKRERDRSVETATEFRQTVDATLTERQRSALESAYAAGYYDWPREITAEELAGSMGVSSSTLHEHLRKGVWSLLQAFLDDHDE